MIHLTEFLRLRLRDHCRRGGGEITRARETGSSLCTPRNVREATPMAFHQYICLNKTLTMRPPKDMLTRKGEAQHRPMSRGNAESRRNSLQGRVSPPGPILVIRYQVISPESTPTQVTVYSWAGCVCVFRDMCVCVCASACVYV